MVERLSLEIIINISLAAAGSADRKVPMWCVLILKIASLGERGD